MILTKLFYTILESSIKSSLLIGIILLVKKIFREKIGAKGQCLLWFLLIIRLTLSNMNLRLFNIFSKINPYNAILKPDYTITKSEIIKWLNNGLSQQSLLRISSNFSIKYLFPSIWILGILILTLNFIVSNIKYGYLIKLSQTSVEEYIEQILIESQRKLNIRISLKAYKSPFVYSPCLYGLFNPCILLPYDIEKKIDIDNLRYVISHELAHYKRKDIFLYTFIYILQIVYWFNPIIWYGLYRMKNDCEIACDALALSSFKEDEKEDYGLCIINLLERSKTKSYKIVTTEFINKKKDLKRRIIMIKKFKEGSYKLSFVTILVFMLMTSIFLSNGNIKAVADNSLNNSIVTNMEDIQLLEMIWPVPNYTKISAPFGKRVHPVTKMEKVHTGIDIPGEEGEIIIAAADGKVVFSQYEGGYGKTIIIDHGNNLATVYAHCSELLVEENDEITFGTAIAKVGSTGASTGPHLHFEVRKDGEAVEPLDYFKNN
ncbi:M23/M56 family metallopeptidase [Tissierella praeacuta]|uniref:M23/M56 family metallopeptidase n=1 Tax=Tissierella praeacuta TaxID=43131 RepID=UPI0033403F0C